MRTHFCGRFAFGGLMLASAWALAPTDVFAEESSPASGTTAMFDRLDANHDGQIAESEVPEERRRLFERLLKSSDKDSNGSLSREEFLAGMGSRRPERAREAKAPEMAGAGGLPDPEQIFALLDANRDGKITASEVPDAGRERFEQLLVQADKDNDGVLTKQEVVDTFKAIREQIKTASEQKQSPEAIFKYLDSNGNGDGKLSVDEVPEPRREGFERLIKAYDADKDGSLNEEEFVKGMTAVRQMQSLGGASKDASAPSSKPQGDSPSAGSSDEPKKPGERLKAMRERGGDPARMLARMAERFKELDKNGDGKLSAEELGDRKRMFEMLDTDKDGFVDQDELKAMGAKLRDRAANANQ